MAILKGFPPSNTISPTIRILDDCDPNKKCYLHMNNVWLKQKDTRKSDRLEFQHVLDWFAKEKHISYGLNESFVEMMVDWMGQVGEAWQAANLAEKALDKDGCPWFVWLQYHMVHKLSVQTCTDVRGQWATRYDWMKNDMWIQARLKEDLSTETPATKILKKEAARRAVETALRAKKD